MADQRTSTHDFLVKQGTTFKRRIRFKVDGVVQSLVGSTVILSADPSDGSSNIVLASNDIIDPERYLVIDTIAPLDNFIEIFFSEDVTDEFIWKQAPYMLDVIDSGGIRRRKLKGRFVLEFKPVNS